MLSQSAASITSRGHLANPHLVHRHLLRRPTLIPTVQHLGLTNPTMIVCGASEPEDGVCTHEERRGRGRGRRAMRVRLVPKAMEAVAAGVRGQSYP